MLSHCPDPPQEGRFALTCRLVAARRTPCPPGGVRPTSCYAPEVCAGLRTFAGGSEQTVL